MGENIKATSKRGKDMEMEIIKMQRASYLLGDGFVIIKWAS